MTTKPQIIVHIEKPLNYSGFDVKWLPKSAKVVVVGSHPRGTGALQVYEVCGPELQLVQDTQRPKALKCATFGASKLEERFIATGSFDGRLEIIDLNRPNNPVYAAEAHDELINAIDGVAGMNIGKGAPEIVTGSRDGTIKIWDPRQKDKSVVTIEAESPDDKRDCWTVAFGNSYNSEERIVGAGFDNGDVKLFDLRKVGLLWETNVKNGVCSLEFDRKDIDMNKLVAVTLESRIYVYDLRTQHPENGFAHLTRKEEKSTTLWKVQHLPQNRDLFATTTGNGTISLYSYIYPSKRTKKLKDGTEEGVIGELKPIQSVTVSSQPIVGFDWNRDQTGLCTTVSLDQTLRVVIVTKLNTL